MAASTPSKKSKRSGNPAKKATSAKGWKKNKGEELELPSGNVALVQRPGPGALLNDGIMPDTLMPIVQQAISKGKGLRPSDQAKLMDDPKKLVEMLDSMDRLLVHVVVEPKVAYHKHQPLEEGVVLPWTNIPEDQRGSGEPCTACGVEHPGDDEVIYSDEVDMEDKMFVFQYAVGGTRNLERFRSEQRAALGNLPEREGDEDPAEPTGGAES
jgi:hypothetical protein